MATLRSCESSAHFCSFVISYLRAPSHSRSNFAAPMTIPSHTQAAQTTFCSRYIALVTSCSPSLLQPLQGCLQQHLAYPQSAISSPQPGIDTAWHSNLANDPPFGCVGALPAYLAHRHYNCTNATTCSSHASYHAAPDDEGCMAFISPPTWCMPSGIVSSHSASLLCRSCI